MKHTLTKKVWVGVVVPLGLSCVSRYYLPPNLEDEPIDTLVEINVSHWDHMARIRVDGLTPWPLFGMPSRRLYLRPGDHEIKIDYEATGGTTTSYTDTFSLIDTKKGTITPVVTTTTTRTGPTSERHYRVTVRLAPGRYDWRQITTAVMTARPQELVEIPPETPQSREAGQ